MSSGWYPSRTARRAGSGPRSTPSSASGSTSWARPTFPCTIAGKTAGEAVLTVRAGTSRRSLPITVTPGPLERLEVIYAHPQTHEQCSNLLDAWERPIIHTSSNAESAVAMRNRPHSGAVVSQMVADLHGVPIILREIQNSPHNITRFVLLRNTPLPAGEGTKCSIIIDPRTDRPGLLHSLLDAFARHGINLTRIESRPSKRGIGSYIFFLDFETSEGWIDAIAELSRLTCVKELGCYGRLE